MKIRASFKDRLKIFQTLKKTSLKKPLPSFVIFFRPDNYVKSINNIDPNNLKRIGVKWVIINTNIKNPESERIIALKKLIKKVNMNGIKVLLLTNSSKRKMQKVVSSLDLRVDAIVTKALKPFVVRRKKLFSYIENKSEALMVANDFLFDTPTGKVLGVETIVIEENFLRQRWIDKKYYSYQREIVTFFLKRKNLINKREDFTVIESQYDEFL